MLGDLDSLNAIISRQGGEWLAEARRPAFDRLVGEIGAKLRPSDPFTIPEFQEPDAWNKAWRIWERLKKRSDQEFRSPAAEAARAALRQSAEIDRRWNEFLNHRVQLLDGIKRSHLRRADILTVLGLEEADLADPVDSDAPGGRRANWAALEYKIVDALHLWQKLSAGDQTLFEFKAAAMRGDEAAKRLAFVEQHLTEYLGKLEDRVAALEHRDLAAVERSKCGEA
jgi:hypothetical protein